MAIETENMADVRTFRAATMNEALDRVRQEMGGEAVILHTRQISQRRFLPWKKREEEVEITAGLGVNIRPAVTRTPTSSRKPVNAAAQAVQSMAAAGPTDELQLRSAPATRTPLVAHSAVVPPQPPNRTPQISSSRFNPDGNTAGLSEQLVATGAAVAAQAALAAPIHPTHNDRTAEFSKKLDAIQKTLEQLGRVSRTSRADEIPTELFHVYTELIDSEVDEDLARELVFRLKEQATPGQLSDTATAKTLLTSMVESEIRCSNPIVPHPGRRKVVALVGATGVGKTTTIAKLAANFRLRDGVKMGLVTVDTYRIAAVEQLRTYAEIIDLPMKVVTSPPEMRRALAELEGLDLVLIDTAGRSPRDDLQIQELKQLLAEANADEVHLVLSMTASMRSLEATARQFAAANTTSLIVTKLDEAAGMGTLLSMSRKIGLPVSYLTTGQDVPDDIESASASRIARLVLGQERLSN